MNRKISIGEMARHFAQYIHLVEEGESFVITRRGKPVTRLLPIEPAVVPAGTERVLTPEQQAARQRALERRRRGFHLGGATFNREELYDERCGVSRADA